ncbi:MAG TPA: chalcone isomerase family protein [Casimicrobiaceae bacterium]|jgi:hypothetical protein|nr:chalcone isomerase family protein [Casimicrobiaceae bacterium]
MRRNLLLMVVIALASTELAQGKECKGVNLPDQVQVAGSTLVLNGLGLRQATMLKVNVYVGALYLTKTSNDASAILASNTPKQIVLHFVRSVGGDDIAKGWSEGFEKNAKAELPALKDRIAMLNGWMADVKSGEQVTFVYTPDMGVQVDVNGKIKGAIKGNDFAKAFFSIWLGDPPNPELKSGMLGGTCG